jgi:hypothetical protein
MPDDLSGRVNPDFPYKKLLQEKSEFCDRRYTNLSEKSRGKWQTANGKKKEARSKRDRP